MALPRVVVSLVDVAAASEAARPAGDGPPRTEGGGPVLRVVLEDVGMQDVLATPLGSTLLPLGVAGPDELEVTLAVPVHLLQTGSRYSLRAHLDRDGSGEVARGDALTTVSVPVVADDVAGGRRVEVPLTQL